MPMRDVILYGALGAQFGQRHRFDVAHPAEAIRALSVNFAGFDDALREYHPGFHVLVGDATSTTLDDLRCPLDSTAPIRIVPAIAGAKSALGAILLGATLLAAAFFMPAAIGGLALFGSTTVASLATTIGFGMVMGGVTQLLSPQPKMAGSGDTSTGKGSNVFTGAANTTAQGGPVPVPYGRMIFGSVVGSMGITVGELPT